MIRRPKIRAPRVPESVIPFYAGRENANDARARELLKRSRRLLRLRAAPFYEHLCDTCTRFGSPEVLHVVRD